MRISKIDQLVQKKRQRHSKVHVMDAHIGQRIRLRRTLLGMTQESLGRGLGVTFQQIQKYERGVSRVSASCLYDIANLLNVPVMFFFDGLPRALLSAGQSEPDMSRESMALIYAYDQLRDTRLRIALLKVIQEKVKTDLISED
jgi:transcriptional regulator with XRE-family HTH domain